jgi:hypothetical protein
MRNILLDERTARDIDDKIARIHRELEYVSGTINLIEVRELLSLDLQFYTADDPDLIDQVVHKLRVGAKQVVRRPALLVEAIRKFDLKALFLPDRKRILLSSDLPELKKRWSEAHEVAHSVIPWHADYMFGDDKATLSPSCHARIEAEANYGSGRLLFPLQVFDEVRRAERLDLARVRAMAFQFGNTITSTLWRSVEADENPSFAVIGEHPHYPTEKPEVEYLIRSKSFARRFPNFSETDVSRLLREYCQFVKRGTLGSGEITIADASGAEHVFVSESFNNSYQTLTLAQYVRPKGLLVQVSAGISRQTLAV